MSLASIGSMIHISRVPPLALAFLQRKLAGTGGLKMAGAPARAFQEAYICSMLCVRQLSFGASVALCAYNSAKQRAVCRWTDLRSPTPGPPGRRPRPRSRQGNSPPCPASGTRIATRNWHPPQNHPQTGVIGARVCTCRFESLLMSPLNGYYLLLCWQGLELSTCLGWTDSLG